MGHRENLKKYNFIAYSFEMDVPVSTVWQDALLLPCVENSVWTMPMYLEADLGFNYKSLLLSLKQLDLNLPAQEETCLTCFRHILYFL